MTLHVRPARSADHATIVDYNRRLAEETEGKSLDLATLEAGVAKLLANPSKGAYYLAEEPESGTIVGQLMITLEWSDWRDGWFWWIQSVYVLANWRGRGVLRKLFEEVRRRAEADPEVVGFRLYVEAENESAQQAYRALGLEETSYQFFELLTRKR